MELESTAVVEEELRLTKEKSKQMLQYFNEMVNMLVSSLEQSMLQLQRQHLQDPSALALPMYKDTKFSANPSEQTSVLHQWLSFHLRRVAAYNRLRQEDGPVDWDTPLEGSSARGKAESARSKTLLHFVQVGPLYIPRHGPFVIRYIPQHVAGST